MSSNIIILNSITKRNKPVELVWCEVILDKRKRHEKFFIKLTMETNMNFNCVTCIYIHWYDFVLKLVGANLIPFKS
jgi:hypothetical protein